MIISKKFLAAGNKALGSFDKKRQATWFWKVHVYLGSSLRWYTCFRSKRLISHDEERGRVTVCIFMSLCTAVLVLWYDIKKKTKQTFKQKVFLIFSHKKIFLRKLIWQSKYIYIYKLYSQDCHINYLRFFLAIYHFTIIGKLSELKRCFDWFACSEDERGKGSCSWKYFFVRWTEPQQIGRHKDMCNSLCLFVPWGHFIMIFVYKASMLCV